MALGHVISGGFWQVPLGVAFVLEVLNINTRMVGYWFQANNMQLLTACY